MVAQQTMPPSRALLPPWANAQDGWCRSIAADILKNRVQASSADIDRYLKILLAEKKLSEDVFELVPKIEEKEVDANPLDAVRIDKICIGDGVNALKAGAEIEFAEGVTVIFGENGSGKSGFVRVLKRAAGVRTAEDILHNIHSGTKPVPSANFLVTVAATSQPVSWKNEFGIAPLSRVSIFDARGARLHVEDELTYIYTPGELTLFPLVQGAIERVRTALDTTISARAPGPNTIVSSFDRSCSIYSTIETLGSATDSNEIKEYAVVPADVDAKIDVLKTEVDALGSLNIQNQLKRARERASLVRELKTAIQLAKDFDVSAYVALVSTRDSAGQRRELAGNKAFDRVGIPGILSEEWRAFIEAGEGYIKKHAEHLYPKGDDACVFCQQPLGTAAVELVKKYREFSNNEIKTALEAAEGALASYLKPLIDWNGDALEKLLAAEIGDGPDVLRPLTAVVAQIRRLRLTAADAGKVEWADKESVLVMASGVVIAEEARQTQYVFDLQSSVEQRQVALKAKQSELTELQARKSAKALLPQIEKRVNDAKWAVRAAIVKNNVPNILRSLTEAAKEASDVLLNKGFGTRFQEECKKLRAPNVTLNFPGRQGQVTRRKLVSSYKPSDVLSEGEQKALALADFLAEVTAVPASSPVVFDDPITSMDYRRIQEVTDRIVALSDDHQVIVFTHNIRFAAELLNRAEKKKWKYYDIRLEAGAAGVVSAASHPRVDTIAQVSGRVKKMIEGAEKQNGEVRAALVEKGYEELRGLCEIVVEYELLKGVVQRYAPNIMMTKLEKINVTELQASVSSIMSIFEKTCRYIASHSQPPETQGIRPTLDELKADHDAIVKAWTPHKT